MPFPTDYGDFYYEAQAFVGYEDFLPQKFPSTESDPSGLYGLGARLGSGPCQFIALGWWGERPDVDLRLEYAGYATFGGHGFRTAAGLVASKDGLRGEPEWTLGLGLDLDVGLTSRWELFLSTAMTDLPGQAWEPGHAVFSLGDGLRWVPGNFGVELRAIWRFGYEDPDYQVAMISLIGRMSLDLDGGSNPNRTPPLTDPDD